MIPGPDDNLVYWCGLVGSEGFVGGRLADRKRRIAPIHYGSATYVEPVDALLQDPGYAMHMVARRFRKLTEARRRAPTGVFRRQLDGSH